jgi:hypothetical protein
MCIDGKEEAKEEEQAAGRFFIDLRRPSSTCSQQQEFLSKLSNQQSQKQTKNLPHTHTHSQQSQMASSFTGESAPLACFLLPPGEGREAALKKEGEEEVLDQVKVCFNCVSACGIILGAREVLEERRRESAVRGVYVHVRVCYISMCVCVCVYRWFVCIRIIQGARKKEGEGAFRVHGVCACVGIYLSLYKSALSLSLFTSAIGLHHTHTHIHTHTGPPSRQTPFLRRGQEAWAVALHLAAAASV